jgi:uncharacterized protein YbjT (DUF2867 family)
MPVLVTRTETGVGRGLVARIAAMGGEVRAYGPEVPVADLRPLGAVCAVGSMLDEGHLETAMEQVHTVVHLTPLPLTDDPALVVEEAATLVTAAVGAGIRRLLVTSLSGASHDAPDPLRRAAAEVEEVVEATPFPSVVVRTSLVDGPETRHALARTPLAAEVLDTLVAPVREDDLVSLLAALDEQRDEVDADHAVLSADGPVAVSLREHLAAVGITPMSLVGRMVERLRPGTSLLAEMLAISFADAGGAPSGWEATGVRPAPVTSPPPERRPGGGA